jgi:hypothetical protein
MVLAGLNVADRYVLELAGRAARGRLRRDRCTPRERLRAPGEAARALDRRARRDPRRPRRLPRGARRAAGRAGSAARVAATGRARRLNRGLHPDEERVRVWRAYELGSAGCISSHFLAFVNPHVCRLFHLVAFPCPLPARLQDPGPAPLHAGCLSSLSSRCGSAPRRGGSTAAAHPRRRLVPPLGPLYPDRSQPGPPTRRSPCGGRSLK